MGCQKLTLKIEGDRLILRDYHPEDVDRYIYWVTHGEWLDFDAPWERSGDVMAPEKEAKIRAIFQSLRSANFSTPRDRMVITLREGNRPLGWVNRYGKERFPSVVYIGIDICEDDCLNRGLGTEALQLWVDYLFENSTFHKIECHTWSFNPRMMRVAEKLGFIQEGTEREVIQWQGQWQDRVRYGMLRSEWER